MTQPTSPRNSRRDFLRTTAIASLSAGTALAGLGSTRAFAQPTAADLQGITLNVLKYDGAPENFFADAGIAPPPYKLNLVKLNPGSDTVAGLASGALDIALTSQIPPILAYLRKLPLTSVAVLQRDVDNNVNTGGILVPANSTIRSVRDLKGKRVAYLRTAVQHYVLLKVLASAGLRITDIEPVALTNPDSFAAFKSGAVDAWSAWGTMSVLAQERFAARVLVPASTYYNGFDVLSSSHAALADPRKRIAIADHLRRQRQFYAWREAQPQAWAKSASSRTGVDVNTYLALHARRGTATRLTGVVPEVLASQNDIVKTFRAADLIDGTVDAAKTWDAGFGQLLG